MYSQNNEEEILWDYYCKMKIWPAVGRILDIGANDGITFSNSRKLIEHDWHAILVEPSPQAFSRLAYNCRSFPAAACFDCAIGTKTETLVLHESGAHVGNDVGLLSTLVVDELQRWGNTTEFTEKQVQCFTFADFHEMIGRPQFDFVSIDAEGMDYEILSQIDLTAVGCSLVCVEHNGKNIDQFIDYCKGFGLSNIILVNSENIIIGK